MNVPLTPAERRRNKATERVLAAERRVAELEAALREAVDLAADGWAYVDPYFREKWDYEGRAREAARGARRSRSRHERPPPR